MYFVSGITGKVGGATARRLLEEGHQVRALARDPRKAAEWSQRGVDVRQGDLTDAAAVAAALEGVDAAFVMQPTPVAVAPGFPEAKALIAGTAEALRQLHNSLALHWLLAFRLPNARECLLEDLDHLEIRSFGILDEVTFLTIVILIACGNPAVDRYLPPTVVVPVSLYQLNPFRFRTS